MVIVVEPVWPLASTTVTVKPLPAMVGVILGLLSTPELKASELPLTPAVPP